MPQGADNPLVTKVDKVLLVTVHTFSGGRSHQKRARAQGKIGGLRLSGAQTQPRQREKQAAAKPEPSVVMDGGRVWGGTRDFRRLHITSLAYKKPRRQRQLQHSSAFNNKDHTK